MKLLLKIVVLCSFFFLIRQLLPVGFPETHDGANHLARLANYTLALKQGQFPPRLAPSFMAGYGYPVFNYNYPLPSIVGIPLQLAHIDVESSMKLILISFLALGALATFFWLATHYDETAALFGTGVYLSAPFLMNNLYVRGVVGEVLAYSIFPCVLWAISYVFAKKNVRGLLCLYASFVGLMLAHNIFAMFLIPTSLFMLGKKLYEHKPWRIYHYAMLFSVLCAIGTAMFFWIPTLFEQSFVMLSRVHLRDFYSTHFPTIQELIASPFSWGYSYPGPVDGMSFAIGGVAIVAVILGIFQVRKDRLLQLPFALVITLLFFMTSFSLMFWNLLNILQFAQFPWRLLGIFTLALVPFSTILFQSTKGKRRLVLVLALFLTVFSMANKQTDKRFHFEDPYYLGFAETSTVQYENTPVTLKERPLDFAPQVPTIENGNLEQTYLWNGSHKIYEVKMIQDGKVTEPTAYFPGWETRVDGNLVQIKHELSGGLLTIEVPQGIHRIESTFTQNTWARVLGNGMSVAGVAGFGIVLLIMRKNAHV